MSGGRAMVPKMVEAASEAGAKVDGYDVEAGMRAIVGASDGELAEVLLAAVLACLCWASAVLPLGMPSDGGAMGLVTRALPFERGSDARSFCECLEPSSTYACLDESVSA
jgi:hypothetical protein